MEASCSRCMPWGFKQPSARSNAPAISSHAAVVQQSCSGHVEVICSHPLAPPPQRCTLSSVVWLPAGVPLVGDPLDSKQAEAVINAAVQQHGRVDGVANCVGSIVLKSAHTTSDTDFDQVGCNQGRGWMGGLKGATRPGRPQAMVVIAGRQWWGSITQQQWGHMLSAAAAFVM